MRPLFPAILSLFAACYCGAPQLAAQAVSSAPPTRTGIFGNWKSAAGSIVRVSRCGAHVCLSLVQLINTRGYTTDAENPNPALRNRPLCGLRIGSNFTLADPGHAVGGTIYDPKTGKTYRATITAEEGRLHLRGYVGIPLFGESQTWVRPAQPVVPCGAAKR
jgi:uncharacterized protein (DUF2147 family)